MKLFLLPMLIFLVSFNVKAQDGYKLIKKAKKEIKRENFDKAFRLLTSAEKADYGFCGNSYYYALGEIGILKSEIYNFQKKFDDSLEILDSYFACNFGVDCGIRDSMRIETLFLKHGKENIKNEFRNNIIIESLTDKNNVYTYEYAITLPTFNYKFKFIYDSFGFGLSEEEAINPKTILKFQPFYKLIEE